MQLTEAAAVTSSSGNSPDRIWPVQALFGNLTLDVIVLTMLYSTAGLGIAIVNDFKSIEGDRCSFLPNFLLWKNHACPLV